MLTEEDRQYGTNVVANGRNWNALKLLTGLGEGRRGHRLVAIDIRFNAATVTVLLKKDSPKGAMVAFLEARTLDDALWVTAKAVKSKRVPWKPDKYRTMRNDKKGKA